MAARRTADNRCFRQPILRVSPLQAATRFAERPRSYWAKYPGQTGTNLRDLANELLWRLAVSQPGATQQASANRNLPVGRQA